MEIQPKFEIGDIAFEVLDSCINIHTILAVEKMIDTKGVYFHYSSNFDQYFEDTELFNHEELIQIISSIIKEKEKEFKEKFKIEEQLDKKSFSVSGNSWGLVEPVKCELKEDYNE